MPKHRLKCQLKYRLKHNRLHHPASGKSFGTMPGKRRISKLSNNWKRAIARQQRLYLMILLGEQRHWIAVANMLKLPNSLVNKQRLRIMCLTKPMIFTIRPMLLRGPEIWKNPWRLTIRLWHKIPIWIRPKPTARLLKIC